MSQIARPELAVAAPARGVVGRAVTICIVVLMLVIVVLGFRPFYTSLVSGSVRAHWLIVIHAAAFSG